MKQRMINNETINGYVFSTNLRKKRVNKKESKAFGKVYITGNVNIAVNADCTDVVTVNFPFITNENRGAATFRILDKFIDPATNVDNPDLTPKESDFVAPTVSNLGIDRISEVPFVSFWGSYCMNDYVSNRNNTEEIVSAPQHRAGFMSEITDVNKQNFQSIFDYDAVLVNTREKSNEDGESYLQIDGYVFDYTKAVHPITLVAKIPASIDYFQSLEISKDNIVFTQVRGQIVNSAITSTEEEESAFGPASVHTVTKYVREFLITWAKVDPYDIGDESILTIDELAKALSDREVHLATVKSDYENRQASAGNAFASNQGTNSILNSLNNISAQAGKIASKMNF